MQLISRQHLLKLVQDAQKGQPLFRLPLLRVYFLLDFH